MPYRDIVSAAYDLGVEEEYRRLTDSQIGEAEYAIFIDLFFRFIPDGKTVIDVGSGSGRYARHLLERNCRVGVVDLSAKSLKAFSGRLSMSNFTDNIIFNKVSCATQLNWIQNSSADAILLMGPLYHLINEEHRLLAINHCRRILKPKGYLFTTFLSPECTRSTGTQGISISDIPNNAEIKYTKFQGFDVPQFRCHPAYAKNLMEANGFKTICMKNICIKEASATKNISHQSCGLVDCDYNACRNSYDIRDVRYASQFLYLGEKVNTSDQPSKNRSSRKDG
jgi:ubiquinone/menaquinone biosynthesis C-methylase UbiE